MEIRFECSCDGFTCEDVSRYNFIRLAFPEEDLALMNDPTDQVISKNEVTLIYKYPFKSPIKMRHLSENGFNRSELIRRISKDYHKIYQTMPEKIEDQGYKSDLDYLVCTGIRPIDNETYEVNVEV